MAENNANSSDLQLDEFIALYSQYEPLIKKIGSFFCVAGDYSYNTMVCDLTTHLWQVWQNSPPGPEVRNLDLWVYSVLYHAALNIVRQERQARSRVVLFSELPELPDLPDTAFDPDPQVVWLYQLISQLDPEEQILITEYLDRRTYAEIAANHQMSPQRVGRQIRRIIKKLILLNQQTEQT